MSLNSAPAAADGDASEPTEDVYREYLTPPYVLLPGRLENGDVTLVDDLTGGDIPLARKGIVVAAGSGNASKVHLPQLPAGTFTLKHPGGDLRITILSFDGTLGPTVEPRQAPWAVYVLAAGFGLLLLAARRNPRMLVVLLAGGVLTIGGVALLAGRDRQDDGLLIEWAACEGSNGVSKDQLACKVDALLERLEREEYDAVRDAVSRTDDPSCHEVTHRASYHVWRTTRDAERAEKLLIPGCDDGLIHGVSESMATFSSDDDFPDLLTDFCSVAVEDFARLACFHGGGHAAVWRTNGDLEASFALCERFPSEKIGYPADEECKGSAVMEWAERWTRERNEGGSTLLPRIDDPMTICLSGPATELFRLGCYLGTNFRSSDARGAAAWCNDREKFLNACYAALGENLPYFETPETTIPLTGERALNHLASCTLASSADARAGCVRSAVRVYSVLRLSPDDGERLCGDVEAADTAACRDGVADARERLQTRGIDAG